uniref:Uncharacterized protein n=1 Tax=Pinguiococcus pyrenoidosus TaxID=172671 RepID=A0A7R9UAF1_9STRA|mmetsp:Transcript_2937/g.11899  ORF Transcript_2937/g.11899 Transcript_2937/m.11899 type:complete len:158 (+) Transcript_2937:103-576(+)
MASSADYAVLKISQTSYLTSSRSSVLIILDSECAGRIQMSDILDGPHAEAFSWEKSMEAYLAEEIRERNFLGVLANLRRHGWVPTMSQSLLRPADPDEPNPQQILLRTYYFERSFGAASGAGSANGVRRCCSFCLFLSPLLSLAGDVGWPNQLWLGG